MKPENKYQKVQLHYQTVNNVVSYESN